MHKLEYKVQNKPGVDCLNFYIALHVHMSTALDTQLTILIDSFESVWLAVPIKEEDEVVEEMETSSSLEEDSMPVISRLVS